MVRSLDKAKQLPNHIPYIGLECGIPLFRYSFTCVIVIVHTYTIFEIIYFDMEFFGSKTLLLRKLSPVWASVVVQLAQWLLPISQVHDTNPVIGKSFIMNIFTGLKRHKKRKSDREWPIFLKNIDPNTYLCISLFNTSVFTLISYLQRPYDKTPSARKMSLHRI